MHAMAVLALGPIGDAEVGAAEDLPALRAPEGFEAGLDGGDAAAGLAADDQALDAEGRGGAAEDLRRAFREVGHEVGGADQAAGAQVGAGAEQAVGASVGADGDVKRAHVLQALKDGHAADEALGQREGVEDEVPGPDAAGEDAAGGHLVPGFRVAFRQRHVGGGAGGAGGGLHLHHIREGRGEVGAEGGGGGEAVADLGLHGEGDAGEVLRGADVCEGEAGFGQLRAVEGGAGLQPRHLGAEAGLLEGADLGFGGAFDVGPACGGGAGVRVGAAVADGGGFSRARRRGGRRCIGGGRGFVGGRRCGGPAGGRAAAEGLAGDGHGGVPISRSGEGP